ncbi:MAG: isovaleryl-CoA dehydrogenase [Deltaproteobacteria bacterium]|nr:MAG: isovaleryl-CoA dehydrogenase [Deltaproteobacteria bacterium]
MTHKTHEVLNQTPPLEDINLFEADPLLGELVRKAGGGWGLESLQKFGARCGSREVLQWGIQANQYLPVLKTHDRFGNRIDEVDFHPAWHHLMSLSVKNGIHSLPWTDTREGRMAVRAAHYLLIGQIEQGHCCPITMTFAAIPALKTDESLYQAWAPKILSLEYDSRFLPIAQKTGAVIGMAMTEKQGGSDVRANTTKAEKIGEDYFLTGHKWFCSDPMCDAFLVLAQAPGGLTCFLVPRWKPDGTRNVFMIQRLKDKLGNRSNASSEIEFSNTWAQRVGEEGRGVPTIIKMVNSTRYDCIIGSTAIMRQALSQAIHHSKHRKAFGKKLIDQPLMKNVLADLSLEVEGALQLVMRLATAYDNEKSEEANLFRRLATAIGKYWTCKRAPSHVYEAMECLGRNGYAEESILPRLYREAPVNSIWEGSGNVNALDVLRAMSSEPRTAEILLQEIEKGAQESRVIKNSLDSIKARLMRKEEIEQQSRALIEDMVLALQATLLVQNAPTEVSEAFCASRLSGEWGRCFGTLPSFVNFDAIIQRSALKVD